MNTGEKGELLVKMKLTQMRDEHAIFNGETIVSVGYFKEYKSPSKIISGTLLLDSEKTEKELITLCGEMNIEKASTYNKSDVYINHKGYSLKSTYGANSALVNHTNRTGFERVCIEVGADINKLDSIIEEYWQLRETGILTEDVRNDNPLSPFKDHKGFFKPILEYFLFTGSGSRRSKYPAEFILEFSDSLNAENWEIIGKDEAIDRLWPKLVFSMRSKKGMPKNYTLNYCGKNATSIAKWVRVRDNECKGALHIRVAENQKHRI